MKKLYDLTVKTGEYQNNQGETKGRYENVGAMMQGDNGPFLFLKRTFNPAGAPYKAGSESIIVSMFEDKPKQQSGQQQTPQQNNSGFDDFDNQDVDF